MITFTKKTSEDMEAFRDAIRQQIIEMAADVIGPINDDWERFDEEIARKLDAGEMEDSEACKIFAEAFYASDLAGMWIIDNKVVFYDQFNVEDTMNWGGYALDEMVKGLRKLYPDVEVFGAGVIDYHYAGTSYVLVAYGDTIDFSEDEGSWIGVVGDLVRDWSVEEFMEENEGFSLKKLRWDIAQYLSKHGLDLTVEDFIEKLGLTDAIHKLEAAVQG